MVQVPWSITTAKRYLTNGGLQLTSLMIQKHCVADPLLVKRRDITDRGIQPTPFGPNKSRHGQGDPTDLLDV